MKIHCIVIAFVLFAPYTSTTSAQKTGKVEIAGLSFAYREEGSGPPVVLIHRSVSDYREWSKQMKHWPGTIASLPTVDVITGRILFRAQRPTAAANCK